MSLTRRLAAILAADVEGYSRLMGADEEGTHERLKAHVSELVDPKIEEHRGRTVKNTGDGMLAEFPSAEQTAPASGRSPLFRGIFGHGDSTPRELRPNPRQSTANTHTEPPCGTSGNSHGCSIFSRACMRAASAPHPDCTAMYCLPSTSKETGTR